VRLLFGMPVHADGRQAGTLSGVALDLPTRSVSHALYGPLYGRDVRSTDIVEPGDTIRISRRLC